MTRVRNRPYWLLLGLLLGGLLLSHGLLGSQSAWADRSDDPGEEPLRQALSTVDSLRTQRDFQSALARLDQLKHDRPPSAEILWREAILWVDVGKTADGTDRELSSYRQGLAVAEKAIEADPTNAWAHTAMAVAAGQVAKMAGSHTESIRRSRDVKEHVDRAIALDSTLAAAYHVRARWHREIADLNFFQRLVVKTVYGGLPDASFEKAAQSFQKAIGLEERTYHHLELGKTYRKMGRMQAARAEFESALTAPWADPFDAEYKQEARLLLEKIR